MHTDDALLLITDLTVRYGRSTILDRVSLRCGVGVYGIYGANGSGKSTLLRTVAGIQEPQSGHIAIAGHDLQAAPVEARRQMGYLAEHFSLYPYLSCRELYETVAALRMVPEEVASLPERLAALGMEGAEEKRLSTLSAGQQRKLTLLVALCGEPPVLLLDEPTKALDVQARQFLSDVIVRWGEEKLVVIASHLVPLLEEHCSEFVLIFQGQCIGQGSLEALRQEANAPGAPLDQVYAALAEKPRGPS